MVKKEIEIRLHDKIKNISDAFTLRNEVLRSGHRITYDTSVYYLLLL